MKRKLLIVLIPLIAIVGIGATIQWYHQATGGTPADGQTMLVENAASNNYVQFKLSAMKDYAVQGVSNTTFNTFNTTNLFTTNLFSSNITALTMNVNYITNITNISIASITEYAYISNAYFTNINKVDIITNNNFYTTNVTVNNSLTVNSNVTFKGNSTFNTVVITNGPYAPTNQFTGPTNNYDLALRKQYYVTFTPMSITNFLSRSNGIAMQSTLVISNGATTNITLLIPNTVGEPTRASSFTVSNASKAFIWFDYADDTGTNSVFRQF